VPTCHPIQEHFRVGAFRQALLSAADSASQLQVLGELMLQSHASYSACGLGSDGTNLLVTKVRQHMAAARAAGREPLLLGAKITGGGCGGTVCILGVAGEAGEEAVQALVDSYAAETGHQPKVFSGSSLGASQFGHLRLCRRGAGSAAGQA
jgi:galactokinase